MTFFNIFDKNRVNEKGKTKIIADNREKNSLVISELIKLNNKVEFEQLDIADYLADNVAVERKTKSDLANSIINKRIFGQIESLKKHQNYLLIIEEDNAETAIHENAIKGFMLSTVLKSRVPVIFSATPKETARYLSILANKKEKVSSLRPSRNFLSKDQQIQFILEGFPNIGPVKARALIQEFKSLKAILNASLEQLEKVLGKQAEDFYNLVNK